MIANQLKLAQELEAGLDKLNSSDKSFAESMLKGFSKHGSFTEKQLPYVEKLLGVIVSGYPKSSISPLIGLEKIYEFVMGSKLKYPKFMTTFLYDHGLDSPLPKPKIPVMFSRAGISSKYSGNVLVTDGGVYPKNKFYGSIDKSGVFTPAFATAMLAETALSCFHSHLELVNSDIPGAIANYGNLTGSCCFCHKALDNDDSVAVGYGPVCAKNYGLPYGTSKKKKSLYPLTPKKWHDVVAASALVLDDTTKELFGNGKVKINKVTIGSGTQKLPAQEVKYKDVKLPGETGLLPIPDNLSIEFKKVKKLYLF